MKIELHLKDETLEKYPEIKQWLEQASNQVTEELNERLVNTLLYGTSHPECIMFKKEEQG